MHSIMNVSVSFPFWHKFAVVNDGFFGMQKELYKRPGQKRGDSGLSRSLCKSFHRNLSILALMPSSHSSWLRTRAQPGWWHPSPHLEYSSFTRR